MTINPGSEPVEQSTREVAEANMGALSGGWFEVTSYCACGGSMQARGVGSLDASVDLRAAFLRVHTGPGHGAATKEEARRARRRLLRKENQEPVMLKSYDEMTADQKLAYEMGREAERARRDDPAEIRAAVVPLLDLEPAVEIVRELIDRTPPALDATTWTLAIVCAALGLGEES